MIKEEEEFNNFIMEFLEKVREMNEKYKKLSVGNKKKFLLYMKPLIRAKGIQGLVNESNSLFGTNFSIY